MAVKTTATKVQRRIAILQDMINRASTPEGEKDAARRALNSLLVKLEKVLDEAPAATSHYYQLPERTYGKNYVHDYRVSTVEIAAMIRSDLKVRRNLGKKLAGHAEDSVSLAVRDVIADAPASIKFSIRSQYFSGGSSIDITIKGVPVEWGWEIDPLYDPYDTWHSRKYVETAALRALKAEVESVQQSYNHDGSDSMVDYFDVRFYGHTEVDWHEVPRD
jgi:hypothetical protein